MYNYKEQLKEYEQTKQYFNKYFGVFFSPIGIDKKADNGELSFIQYYFMTAFNKYRDKRLLKDLCLLNYEPLYALTTQQQITSIATSLRSRHPSERKQLTINRAVEHVFDCIERSKRAWLQECGI